MEYHKAPPAATFSKKLANGGVGLSGKHVYDGVFDGAVKSGKRGMEDYREIFGGCSDYSIPILDFPEMNQTNSSRMDVRSSKPDYSTVFGGFSDSDFAVPYEDLLSKRNKVQHNRSSKKARSPVQASLIPPVERDNSNFSKEKKVSSPEECLKSFEDERRFNVSYNKSGQGNKNVTNGLTRIAHLGSVPAYSYLIDETTPSSQITDTVKPVRSALDDARVNVGVSDSITTGKHLRKVVSGPQPGHAAANTPASHAEPHKRSSRNRSFSNDMSFDAFGVGVGAQSSTMTPLSSVPNFANNKRSPTKSMNAKFGSLRSNASEGGDGSYSPPFLDEVDANSAAAASAAALRKVIEEAREKMKIAKELMERKRQCLHRRAKSSFTDGTEAGRENIGAAERVYGTKEEAQEVHTQVYDRPMQVLTELPENHPAKINQVAPDIRSAKNSSPLKQAIGETHDTQSKQDALNHPLEAEKRKATDESAKPAVASGHGRTALDFKQQATNVEKMETDNDDSECKDNNIAGEKNMKKPTEIDEKLNVVEEAPKEKIERVLNSVAAVFKWDIFRNIIKSNEDIHRQEENEHKAGAAYGHEEADLTPQVFHDQEQCESIAKGPHGPEEPAKSGFHDLVENRDLEELEDAEDWVESEKETEVHIPEQVENESNDVPLRNENETELCEIVKHEEFGYKPEDFNRVEDEQKLEGWDCKENEGRENDVRKSENTWASAQVHQLEISEGSSTGVREKEESEKRLTEDCGTIDNEHLEKVNGNEKMSNQMNKTNREKFCVEAETEEMQTDFHMCSDDENGNDTTQHHFRFQETNLEASSNAYKINDDENESEADEAPEDERFEEPQASSGLVVEENDRTMEVTGDLFPKAVKESQNRLEEDAPETVVPEQGLDGIDEIKKQMSDVYLSGNDMSFDNKPKEYVEAFEQERHSEEVTSPLDENDRDVCKSQAGTSDEENDSNSPSCSEEQWFGTVMESKTFCSPEKQAEGTVCEFGDNKKDVKEFEVATDHENEAYIDSCSEEKWVQNMIRGQACHQSHTIEGEGKDIRVSPQETPQERTSQSTDKNEEGHRETLTVEKRNADAASQSKVEVESKQQERNGEKGRELEEEAKMREMEMEKQRVAVERAIREARERAFAEARERAAAEKAAAEARQRVVGTRERLDKSCTEANGKSTVEKASMEAKLKAERAAVERATAEARERALERVLSEKGSFKARNQVEKVSTASSDAGLNSTDQQFKGPGPSSSSRYPTSTNHDERLNGTNGEPVERCKAALERNQRTAERAAKALAEKNMRDLLAEKEQAERNRLAEVLDADVRRWSSGKERNLRALLSTLQYILGPDGGWRPIPLTDLISNAAVKKAYRKATLFVHPDKLQQRGASIQQKYTCEKVFDLLKDAWDKFSAEER